MGRDPRKLYTTAVEEVTKALNRWDSSGTAAAVWAQGRHWYNVGSMFLDILQSPRAFYGIPAAEGAPAGVEMATNFVKKQFGQHIGFFRETLEPSQLKRMVDILYHGAPVGSLDRLPRGADTLTGSVNTLLRGEITGEGQYARITITTVFRNIGAELAGRQPYPTGPTFRTIADLVGINLADEMRQLSSGGQ